MTTSLYAPVASPGDVSAKNYTSLYSDSLTPGPNPSGDVTIQGNLTVRGGNIYTTATTASVFPHNATTVNAFTAATTLNLAGDTGFTTINNELKVGGKAVTLMANITGSLPPGDEYGLVVNRGSSEQEASLIWVETGTRSTSYWNIDADTRIQGDTTVESLLFVDGDQIIGNATGAVPTANFSLVARRGLPTYPDVSIVWNGTANKWQFTNDGTTFYDLLVSGSGGSATFGKITIGVVNDHLIGTTSGPLSLASANGEIQATTSNFTANNLYANTSIISYGTLGTYSNFLVVNYNDTPLSSNAGFVVRRGAGTDVALRWNYTTNRWQFSNDGVTYYDMVSSIDDLTDVIITSATAGQLLTYDGTDWINNYNIVGSAANQTINHVRSGAFNGDTATSTRNAARFTKKFTDVTGAPTDRGGPGLTFSVQDSANTTYTYASITSNYSSTGDHDVRILTSTDNFATANEAVSFTATETTFPATVTVGGTVNANAIVLDSRVIKNTSTATYTSTSQQVFGNVPIATYRTIKHTWQISRGSEFQTLETIAIHDGTSARITSYADLRTGNNLADFNVDISGGNMRILVTPTSATSTVLVCDYTLFYI